jgi:hypothetical protein
MDFFQVLGLSHFDLLVVKPEVAEVVLSSSVKLVLLLSWSTQVRLTRYFPFLLDPAEAAVGVY